MPSLSFADLRLIQEQMEAVRRAFPELAQNGRNTLAIGLFTESALSPAAVRQRWAGLYGKDVSISEDEARKYAQKLAELYNNPDSPTKAFTATFREEGSARQKNGRKLYIIGLSPSLYEPDPPCAAFPPEESTSRRTLKHFRVLNHELGHVLADVTGFDKEVESRHGRTTPPAAAPAPPRPPPLSWGQHWREHVAETFTLLRTVQVYGEEGYQEIHRNLVERVREAGTPESSPNLLKTYYYPPSSRFALLEWARENTADLRAMSMRDLFTLARRNAPPLSPDSFADLQNRTAEGRSTLSVEAAHQRQRSGSYAGTLPYLQEHDQRMIQIKNEHKSEHKNEGKLQSHRLAASDQAGCAPSASPVSPAQSTGVDLSPLHTARGLAPTPHPQAENPSRKPSPPASAPSPSPSPSLVLRP